MGFGADNSDPIILLFEVLTSTDKSDDFNNYYYLIIKIVCAVIWYQVFLPNINNLYTITWFQAFLSFLNRSIDRTSIGTFTLGQIGTGSNGNKRVFHTPQGSRSGASSLDTA